MEKRRKDYLEGMNEIKRIFDHFGINRLNTSLSETGKVL